MLHSLGLAGLAGLVSILSPCVLPLLPIVLGTAAAETRLGPLALAGGLVMSFCVIGMFVGILGLAVGLDGAALRSVGAIMLILIGLALIVPRLQASLATASGPLSHWTERTFGGASGTGAFSQFGVGLMLGAVWSPCVGPTLGAASLLAAQGQSLAYVAAVMLAFASGAALPLLGIGLMSRQALMRWRRRLFETGRTLKAALGAVLILNGGLIVSGLDRSLETVLTEASPLWLTDLTSRF
jgi:cytochrome c biogenesis protein CcdA